MKHPPLLIIELPIPAGREDDWNQWYHEVHIPDFLKTVEGAVRTSRYRLVDDGSDDLLRYLVLHEFDSVQNLTAYQNSTTMGGRLNEYVDLWGTPGTFRRRAFEPIFEADRPV